MSETKDLFIFFREKFSFPQTKLMQNTNNFFFENYEQIFTLGKKIKIKSQNMGEE